MPNYRELLDELFVSKLGYEFQGEELPKPEIDGKENIVYLSREYSANGVDVIVADCEDRIPEFQKKLIKHYKSKFPDSHFLFISNNGKVFDLYNVSSSQRFKKITYNEIDKNTRLFKEKIELFNVEHAEGTVDLKIRIDKAFDISDRITRQFFDNFKDVHKKLKTAIKGIKDDNDKNWYASVLMNRIMFIYFLQKHYVIQDDADFLLNKYNEVKKQGDDYFKDFLLPLFYYGFAKRDTNPNKLKFIEKYGYVKYLNGGLFYPHFIESKYTPAPASKSQRKSYDDPGWIIENIKIKLDGKAIAKVLKFLNKYTWYLDSRPMKEDTDINPDVLGFIFEKYINQKELGAYYTKEDITEYISKFTIIPFIFDKLRSNGYDAPDTIPIVTNNEDIIGEMERYLEETDDYDTLKFLYKDILEVLSILDPAVGSGAFLFAALNILLPIYRKVIFKLKAYRNKKKDDIWLQELCDNLDNHSEEYYLTKQIILNNLYGIDIVEEAVEICKLRLFLQLASHLPNIKEIEPLPDIDFNIYAGNSLVGGLNWDDLESNYTMDLFTSSKRENIKNNINKLSDLKEKYKRRINEQIAQLNKLKTKYKEIQQEDIDEEELISLKGQIEFLEHEINSSINIGVDNPFHWFVEFNKIIERGGIDVIIGNPPYVLYSTIDEYEIKGYQTINCNDLYGYFIERAINLLSQGGYFGYILPISLISTDGFETVRKLIINNCSSNWYSSYSMRPGKLFDGVEKHLCIWLSQNNGKERKLYGTKYYRWKSEERDLLFKNLKYTEIPENIIYNDSLPKIGTDTEKNILSKMIKQKPIGLQTSKNGEHIVYHTRKLRYYLQFLDEPPKIIHEDGVNRPTSELKEIKFDNNLNSDVALAAYCSTLFYWYYIVYSDCRNVNKREVISFPLDLSLMDNEIKIELQKLSRKLMDNLQSNSEMRTIRYKKYGILNVQVFKPRLSKPIVDKIDRILSKHYGFTRDETDFIINYDIEYRLGENE